MFDARDRQTDDEMAAFAHAAREAW
jgi:hypothetical protein